MANANDVVNIAQSELQQLVCQDTRCIRKTKQRMIRKDGPKAHCSSVQDCLMAKTTEASMAMHYLDLFPDYDVPKDGKERENCRQGGLAVDDQEWNMVHFEAIGEVSDTAAALVRMSDDDNFVATINEFGRKLIDMALDAAGLREEEIADHSNIVRHLGGRCFLPIWQDLSCEISITSV